MVEQQYTYAVGRRKTSVAQVRLYQDAGPIVVEDKLIEEAFPFSTWQQIINEPFTVTNTQGKFRVVAKVKGGGVSGRAGAIRHGISRALAEVDNGKYRGELKKAGLLTRDSRVKERKKPGLKGARKAKQYTKR
ncbi:MAG: 30S ribosomal protein S9 [SAR202 cluster bacterium]|nr:MAG: 30S ribosomal protein S9 [SAR202 cluster bacterium]MEC7733766.1 30S ribosomal protein S9 [Chloroflexota bacterium]KAA1304408.1 MAG: 30S ribosomal protein S9 [SAR202 cluster bacterium]MED5409127.1 30S ribosomal protein S9 [Chloroflexota bacterium]MED5450275.1 30S ribosomal protein S9 [Chloroflexota bacterium]